MSVDVVTLGETMVLLQPLRDGSMAYSSHFERTLGGAESNFSIAMTRLGIRARWISRLGVDPFGDYVLRTITGEGVDTSYVIRDEHRPTGLYFKDIRTHFDPNVYYYRRGSAASQLSPRDIRPDWFAGAKLLHVTGITPALGPETAAAVRSAMQIARAEGLVVSFDPNVRRKLWDDDTARETLLSLVPLCDVILPGLDEAAFLFGAGDETSYAATLLQLGVKAVVLKLGAEGSSAYTVEGHVRSPGVLVKHIVDTVGAGDAFAAGFWSEILKSDAFAQMQSGDFTQALPTLASALHLANQLGALTVQFRGDWEGLPTTAELQAAMAGHSSVTR